jgi:hypothetical protein
MQGSGLEQCILPEQELLHEADDFLSKAAQVRDKCMVAALAWC